MKRPLPPPSTDWLRHHRADLRSFAAPSADPDGGFAWLDDDGAPVPDRPVELWITCRMTHVFALGVLEGDDVCRNLLDHGMAALSDRLRDKEFGGWLGSVGERGPVRGDKEAYGHAFVVLAASSAVTAGHPDAAALLDVALREHDTHFWDATAGLVVDTWDRSFSRLEPYRGVNANMHTVEALLAAADATGDQSWSRRAATIVDRVVNGFAAGHEWRLPEHFTPDWEARLDYNRDVPDHPFRPFGVTIGHLFEWSRLTLHTRTALGEAAPSWMEPAARALFASAVRDGWHVDGAEGFVYTTDFDGVPVVRERLHWVVTEALAAAWALHAATGDQSYLTWYAIWWDHARRLFVDDNCSWRHELDAENRPAARVWQGRPDVYHAYQAALLPDLTDPVSFADGLRAVAAESSGAADRVGLDRAGERAGS